MLRKVFNAYEKYIILYMICTYANLRSNQEDGSAFERPQMMSELSDIFGLFFNLTSLVRYHQIRLDQELLKCSMVLGLTYPTTPDIVRDPATYPKI